MFELDGVNHQLVMRSLELIISEGKNGFEHHPLLFWGFAVFVVQSSDTKLGV